MGARVVSASPIDKRCAISNARCCLKRIISNLIVRQHTRYQSLIQRLLCPEYSCLKEYL